MMFAEEEVAKRPSEREEPLPIDADLPAEGELDFGIC